MRRVDRVTAIWRSLSHHDRVAGGHMVAAIAALNIAGWGVFVGTVMPHHFRYAGLGVGLGVAVTAWTLGARHAFDADHIAAIDNSTRKLIADRKPSLSTGFFFALGHSSIMLVVGTGLTIAARTVFGAIVRPNSMFEAAGGVTGTVMSASFLWLIAAMNFVVLVGIWRVLSRLRSGRCSEGDLERQLHASGLMARFFRRWLASIRSPRQMFFVGVVFGIGFDTATEVLLLAATAAAATQGLPFYAVLALPLLFAGGMTLFDSLDGLLMRGAYGWAAATPVRKLYYNLTITGLSVAVAFIIGGIEVMGVLSNELHLRGWLGTAMADFNLNTAGFIVFGLFVAVWAVALAVWKFCRIESRWTPVREPTSSEIGA